MTRKSKHIGQSINGFLVLDSLHKGTQTKFIVRCEACGAVQEKTWGSVINQKTTCDKCNPSRVPHNAKRGDSKTDLYREYSMILTRIRAKSGWYYQTGIKMCEEWERDFQKFKEWALANGYKKGLTIDRIDNSKGYEPSNCRWATPKDQSNNKTNNVIVEYRGERMTVAQCCDKYDVARHLVYQRLRSGKTIQEAIETPIDKTKWSVKKKNGINGIKN